MRIGARIAVDIVVRDPYWRLGGKFKPDYLQRSKGFNRTKLEQQAGVWLRDRDIRRKARYDPGEASGSSTGALVKRCSNPRSRSRSGSTLGAADTTRPTSWWPRRNKPPPDEERNEPQPTE